MKRIPAPVIFFAIATLAYGLLIPWLGFYWDDLPMSWIRYELGPQAMTRYFSTNRPVWGWLYQVTTHILPQVPVYWQVFALLLRALSGILVYAIIRRIYRGRESFAITAALFFMLYPGFNQQWGSYLYSHFFVVLNFFLASFYFMLRAIDEPENARKFTVLAILFSVLNLWMMEYFFFAELIRPFILFFALRNRAHEPRLAARKTLRLYIPFAITWLADLIWRTFIFNNQIYETSLPTNLKTDFVATLGHLAQMILASFWTVSGQAWGQVFQLPSPAFDGPLTTAMVAVVSVTVLVLAIYQLRRAESAQTQPADSSFKPWHAVVLGLLAMFVAGWPFWLIDFPPVLAHPANRFTLPFMFGVSILLAGLIESIPRASWKFVLSGLLIALAAGRQVRWADEYRADWERQTELFWQLSWRAPGLKTNTTILINEWALQYYADNSLSAALNWTYAPHLQGDTIPYVLFFPTNRIGASLPALEAGLPIHYDFLAGEFSGNTSQVLALYYQPPGCVHVLDPEIDILNHFIPIETLMRDAAALSSSEWILSEKTATLPSVYGPEPEHGWCYYFEQADLARQQGNWAEAVRLGEVAFALADHPNDPIERYVFVEASAHVGDWAKALELSDRSYRVSREFVRPSLCALWARIARETTPSAAQAQAVTDAMQKFGCK